MLNSLSPLKGSAMKRRLEAGLEFSLFQVGICVLCINISNHILVIRLSHTGRNLSWLRS